MSNESESELKRQLDAWVARFNTTEFIAADPISIPRGFSRKEDIEIAGLFAATLAWGQRVTILANAQRLMAMMDFSPFEFVSTASTVDLRPLKKFVHRTFNGADAVAMVLALRRVYGELGGLEAVVTGGISQHDADVRGGLIALCDALREAPRFPARTHKHVADVRTGSAAKRLNMYLRWMVRRDAAGVDFGLWRGIRPSQLLCPLDVHSGREARDLGLLTRTQNDFRAVLELTEGLRALDPDDPVKYDLALFGLGVAKERIKS